MPRRYDAVLFDFDGVLADTEPLHCRCWQQVLAPFGIDLSWEAFTRIGVGHADRDLVARLAAQRDPPIPFDELWAEYPRKRELFRKLVAETTPFPPATISLVSELSRVYKLAVVSSSARTEVEPALVAAGVRKYFVELICANDVQHLKPAPDPYLHAAEMLGCTRPLVVEDSDAGVTSANDAGFDCVRLASTSELARVVLQRLEHFR